MSPWRLPTDRTGGAIAALALLLAGCGSPPTTEPWPEDRPEPSLPHSDYHAAATRGATVFELDPQRSMATLLVRRDGPLARLGHDHVIRVGAIRGLVSWHSREGTERRADLWLAVSDLDVDPADLRHQFGLDTEPSAADIARTRENMLRHVLTAEAWPHITMRVRWLSGSGDATLLRVALSLKGHTRELDVPAQLAIDGNALSVTGAFTIRQTDWGIEPFAALGGALRVADEIEVSFRLEAGRRDVIDLD